jgi:hypothetical protein
LSSAIDGSSELADRLVLVRVGPRRDGSNSVARHRASEGNHGVAPGISVSRIRAGWHASDRRRSLLGRQHEHLARTSGRVEVFRSRSSRPSRGSPGTSARRSTGVSRASRGTATPVARARLTRQRPEEQDASATSRIRPMGDVRTCSDDDGYMLLPIDLSGRRGPPSSRAPRWSRRRPDSKRVRRSDARAERQDAIRVHRRRARTVTTRREAGAARARERVTGSRHARATAPSETVARRGLDACNRDEEAAPGTSRAGLHAGCPQAEGSPSASRTASADGQAVPSAMEAGLKPRACSVVRIEDVDLGDVRITRAPSRRRRRPGLTLGRDRYVLDAL